MRSLGIFFLIQFIFLNLTFAQSAIDHWEAVVKATNTWKYFPGNSQPTATWIDQNFDDTSWSEGIGGFGYGDGDDGTVIGSVSSVYLRIKFTIIDLTQIETAIFLADYDDAYIAYLNGVEISRSGISGNPPAYNQYADSEHEASLYQGQYPTEIPISKSIVDTRFKTGVNILTIQVHNLNATSSDLSSNFYLNVGLNVSNTQYQLVPAWFKPPVDYVTSNLPIIKINTRGNVIVDEPKINASMGIIDNGEGNINHVNDPFNNYDGKIGIEIRGSSSQMFPKKQYAVELWTATGQDTVAALLGMPVEADWILSAPYTDKSLIRDVLTYKLGADLGWYAPRTRFCELFLNDQYQGVYILTEKIKQDKNRVDVSKLNPDENLGDDLTGGYIVKLDKYDGATQGMGWNSPYPPANSTSTTQIVRFQFHYPKEDEISVQQSAYIQAAITDFEKALKGPNFRDSREGYRKYINIESFIDFAIINELSRNVDGYRLSTYLYKDKDSKDSKIYIGPLWDFNLAFGNADYCNGGLTTGWAWDFNDICSGDYWMIPFWWSRLLRDQEYVIQFQNRWTDLRAGIYSNASIMEYIDSIAVVLDEPQQRNYTRWPILSEYIWPNNYVGGTYPNEINYLKNWITNRLTWLDTNIAGLQVITDLDEFTSTKNTFSIYPNPNDGNFHIFFTQSQTTELNLSVHDNLGRIVYQEKIYPGMNPDHLFSTKQLSGGIYFMRITDKDKLLHTEKIMVN